MFCSLFSDCLKVLGSPTGAIRWFSPFLCRGMRRQAGSLAVEREQGKRGDNNMLQSVDFCRIFCPAMPGPCWLWSCASQHTVWIAAVPLERHNSLHVLRISSTGQSGCPGKAGMVFPRGWWLQTEAPAPSSAPADGCSAAGGTWAVSHSPAVPRCIWPSGLLSVLPSLLCLSPLSGVNNGVNEAGGARSGCCRVAHSRCGGKCAYQSVSCGVAISGALGPLSSFTGSHFRGAILNSLAPLCHLFLEVTCSVGCQQVVLYLH